MVKLKVLTGRLPDPYMLPTASVGLNRALEGGLMGGRIHIFWGPKASGKTTQALFEIAEAQRMGKVCAYVDAEKTFRSSWAERCGVDVDALKYIRGNSVESILETILPMIAKEEVDLVVLDSLSSIFVESYINGENNSIGIGARSMNNLIAKILGAMAWETQVILIAHATMKKAGQNFLSSAKLSESAEHWASTIIKFRQGLGKEDMLDDGSKKVYWTVQKSKQSPYPVSGNYWLSLKTQYVFVDKATEVASLLSDVGITDKRGAWIYYGDEKWQGDRQFAAALKADHDLFNSFVKMLNEVTVVPEDVEADDEDEDR